MSQYPKRLILNGFAMTVVGHVSAGLWRHPSDRASEYTTLSYWTDLARLLESGGFDALFLADALGHLDVFGGTPDASLRNAAQSPVNDPLLLVSAMAAATRHLGFGITVSTTYEQPYLLARKFTTLDHLTEGRIAWNVVTSVLDSAARNLGLDRQIAHDERYDRAQEFLDVTYKLWEGSWEDDAVVRDRERGVYTDPAKVHPIGHKGRYYTVPGPHLSEPSPQRTPVIFQAGTSPRGREFAARNAEVVFLGGTNAASIRRAVTDIKERAAALGRRPESVKFITSVTVVTGPDDESARRKYEDYLSYTSVEAALALFSAWTGVDWSRYDLDHPLEYIETDAGRSALATLTGIDADRRWTLRDIAEYIGVGGIHPKIVGGPRTVADRLESFADEAGVDGYNLGYAVSPGTFEDFIEYVVPELRRRGLVREAYPPGVLREKLQGAGRRRLGDDHPGAAFRRVEVPA
ncbi:LLM class flavin-dependent oxidoreductase [Microbispora sp. GKU 823]|uniref:LLM class flavin-dependent oxidoreductase n=1 Tax=Microbispora sp. GKU 823 TaxID=1652100 RepID=UPI0009A298A2|nr:LLM class flavin-dependent oxidoreductase [Microbispora sp. GKU 823]OPG04621.1 5,10-methylene tetrahydromethanopterin reductase [Microbispora sp. GKU 823]